MKPLLRILIQVVATTALWATSHAAGLLGPTSADLARQGLSVTDTDPLERIPPEVLAQLRGGTAPALRQRGLALRRQLDARPNDPYVMHALATVMYHQGSGREAMAIWRATSRREPNLASAELMAGLQVLYLQLATGKTAAARAQLAQLEKQHGRDPHFLLVRGEQAVQADQLPAADAAYRKAHELGPRLWVTALNLGRFLDRVRKDAAGAGALYQQATQLAPQRPEPWNHQATFLLKQNQPDAALAALRKVKALDSQAALPEWRMAEMSNALGRHEEARKWYAAALATQPPAEQALAMRVALGDVLLRLKRTDEARREIEAVLKVRPLPPLVFALGTLDESEGKFDAAEQRYRQILKQTPGHALAANNLAMVLMKTGKGSAEALTLAEQARKALPNNAIVDGTWGCAMVENQRGAAAIKVLQAAARAQIDADAWTHYCLGKALHAERRDTEALAPLQRVLALDARFARRDEVERLLAQAR